MQGTAVVTEIVEILTSGLVNFGAGIGEGISALVQNIFFVTTEGATTMSVFGILICVFAAISLTIGLSKLLFNWLTSLGN